MCVHVCVHVCVRVCASGRTLDRSAGTAQALAGHAHSVDGVRVVMGVVGIAGVWCGAVRGAVRCGVVWCGVVRCAHPGLVDQELPGGDSGSG